MAEAQVNVPKTTIMMGVLEPVTGRLAVYAQTFDGMLPVSAIGAEIKDVSTYYHGNGNFPNGWTEQEKAYWVTVKQQHRLVYHLTIPNWFFPTRREMMYGRVPWKLKSADPEINFGRPQVITQGQVNGDSDAMIKTVFVDDAYKTPDSVPFVFDLNVDIWDKPGDPNSWITPITIDPGTDNDETE